MGSAANQELLQKRFNDFLYVVRTQAEQFSKFAQEACSGSDTNAVPLSADSTKSKGHRSAITTGLTTTSALGIDEHKAPFIATLDGRSHNVNVAGETGECWATVGHS